MINLRSWYGQSFFLSFFFFNDGTTGIGEENCASLHVSKNRDNFQVSWTGTHSVKFPAIKKVISDCAISKKEKKGSSRRIYSCFFTHNGITTPKTTREGQESATKTSLHLACPPKFKNQVLFTPRAQSRFLDLGLLLRGCRPKSRSLPGRVEVIQSVVRACTTFWLSSTRITLTRVHRAHKAFYLSSQVEPSDSALWVKGTTRKQPGTVKLQVGRPITVHFSMPTATHRDFPWSILITALWAAAHRAHRFRLSKIEKTSNSKLSLVNFPFEFFQAVFINRFVCDSSFTWYKKVGNSQKLNSRGGGTPLISVLGHFWLFCTLV